MFRTSNLYITQSAEQNEFPIPFRIRRQNLENRAEIVIVEVFPLSGKAYVNLSGIFKKSSTGRLSHFYMVLGD